MRQDGLVSSDPTPTTLVEDSVTGAGSTVHDADPSAPSQVSGDAGDDPAQPQGPTVVLLDPAALQLARQAAEAEAGRAEHIGEFLVALAEDEIAITAQFAAAQPGYLGWHWSITLAVITEDHPTVSEVVLLPGDGALLAPAWIPWEQRIRPGDVGIGDLLPLVEDDPRVVPAYLQSDDPAVEAVARELGIGRVRVLSREGRVDFAERLHDGHFGSADEVALAAPAHCVTCAFYLPLAGSLGQLIGACGNEYSPADGRVVDAGYGCGAHSETVIVMPARSAASEVLIDEVSLEVHRRPEAAVVTDDLAADSVLGDPVVDGDGPDAVDEVVVLDAASLEAIDIDTVDPDVLGAEFAQGELAQALLLDADSLDADVQAESDPAVDEGQDRLPATESAVPLADADQTSAEQG